MILWIFKGRRLQAEVPFTKGSFKCCVFISGCNLRTVSVRARETEYHQTGCCFRTDITSSFIPVEQRGDSRWPLERWRRGDVSHLPPIFSYSRVNFTSSAILGSITWLFKLSLGKPDTLACSLLLHVSLKMSGRVSHHFWWWHNYEHQQESVSREVAGEEPAKK